MIKRKQRIPMLDLSTLSGEDAETAVKSKRRATPSAMDARRRCCSH
jgi:hypothetical protein